MSILLLLLVSYLPPAEHHLSNSPVGFPEHELIENRKEGTVSDKNGEEDELLSE